MHSSTVVGWASWEADPEMEFSGQDIYETVPLGSTHCHSISPSAQFCFPLLTSTHISLACIVFKTTYLQLQVE